MPRNQQPLASIARRIADALAQRGCRLFDEVSFDVNGSHELPNALLHFANESDLNYNQFMRIESSRDIARLGLALRDPGDSAAMLACAKHLQIMLFVLSEEIEGLVKGQQPAPLRTQAQAASLKHDDAGMKNPPHPL